MSPHYFEEITLMLLEINTANDLLIYLLNCNRMTQNCTLTYNSTRGLAEPSMK